MCNNLFRCHPCPAPFQFLNQDYTIQTRAYDEQLFYLKTLAHRCLKHPIKHFHQLFKHWFICLNWVYFACSNCLHRFGEDR